MLVLKEKQNNTIQKQTKSAACLLYTDMGKWRGGL